MAHVHNTDAEQILDKEFKVLDRGFVRLIDYMGGDKAIVQAARVSYGGGTKKVSEDRSLIRYLLRHRHTTPFEMVELKFHVKLPVFVARQWIRHRSANVNEYSGRYSVMKEEFYLPEPKDIRYQSTVNKQGRSSEEVPNEIRQKLIDYYKRSQSESYAVYHAFVEDGLARELARINLPLSLYTEWYWKIDLHNLFHFLRLRMDSHAQYEIQQYAIVMAEMVRAVAPIAYEAFVDYQVDSACFSRSELSVLRDHLMECDLDIDTLAERGLSKREARELRDKMRNIRKME